MSIWAVERPLPAAVNNFSQNTMISHLGIEFTEIGDDYVRATMPVDDRTVQPMRMLHGGASVTLAETLGSYAATLCLDPSRQVAVGLEINANHIRSARGGTVTGTARPIHLGKRTHVWEIRIEDDKARLTCISRITLAILDH
jgi:1,4-dihydroxy-2-naphthoyl-CoA hydrolase